MLRRDISKALFAAVAGAVPAAWGKTRSVVGMVSPSFPRTPDEIAAGVSPMRTVHPPGSVLRYGADPTGSTLSDGAFNNALKCNAVVFDDYPGGSRYLLGGPVRMQRSGQILKGQGFGKADGGSGTVLRYVGQRGHAVVSLSNGTSNASDCVIDGLVIDGNNRANIGLEVYDEKIKGGNWRNSVRNCVIQNVTGGENPTAVYLGLGGAAPSFANDSVFEAVFVGNSGRGFCGNGAIYRLIACTVQACRDAAIYAGPASVWNVEGCVFSSNNRDVDGSEIHQFTATGCWFENSTSGIYRAATRHSVCFTGCYLHTFSHDRMMDFGDSAGYHFLGGNYIPSDTRSLSIVNVNSDATGAVLGQSIPMTYASKSASVPLLLLPMQPATGAVRSVSGTLVPGEDLVLKLGRGTFLVGVSIWAMESPQVRSQATYSAFLFDGDHEEVVQIASRAGNRGAQSYDLVPSGNSVTLTYRGEQTANVSISGTGAVG
jgi:hypothetical protein